MLQSRYCRAIVLLPLGVVCIAVSLKSAHGADATATVPRFMLEWGGHGAEKGQFDFPIGIAINCADEIFITDFYNARVQKFTSDGKFLAAFSVSRFPGGIALDRRENLYVSHGGIPPSRYDKPRERDKIAVFSPEGKPLFEWGKFGTGDGEFDTPGGIAIQEHANSSNDKSRSGRIYVADQCNRRIQVFDMQGKFLTKWGKKGFQPGEFGGNPHAKAFFAGPTFLALDRQGNLYTTEAPLCRVQKFDPDGKPLAAWGSQEKRPGAFGDYFTAFEKQNMRGPTGLCFDSRGRIWINAIGGRIQQFTASGEYLTGFGAEGTTPGKFYAPHGLAIDSHGCLYVVDSFNHRIQKFAGASDSRVVR